MQKALKAIQRSFLRAPLKHFVLSQKQHEQRPMSQRDVAMKHKIKEAK
jgi:hypothetical protein